MDVRRHLYRLCCVIIRIRASRTLNPLYIEPFTQFYASPGILSELMHIFVATDLTPATARPDLGERIRVEVLDLQDAYARLHDGAIVDSKTIATLLLYQTKRTRP